MSVSEPLFKAPVTKDEWLEDKPGEMVAAKAQHPHVYAELYAANREIRRLRVCLNLIANAPRKSTVADLKEIADRALAKSRDDE